MEMRFEAKTEADALERAALALNCATADVKYLSLIHI